jgi:hypothetical protein
MTLSRRHSAVSDSESGAEGRIAADALPSGAVA